ncbi:hypothetical protein ILUMI_05590 [Ignelater luminosus]|uniref:Peptidase S1 domain-containing protein n=1 Tax=Ignelater luminosus TaxID=2038154 RepID=A0A8K0DAT3_IGNLU|nr:hypothetical protein ILUMI_05590 [Ignelater luminosus]
MNKILLIVSVYVLLVKNAETSKSSVCDDGISRFSLDFTLSSRRNRKNPFPTPVPPTIPCANEQFTEELICGSLPILDTFPSSCSSSSLASISSFTSTTTSISSTHSTYITTETTSSSATSMAVTNSSSSSEATTSSFSSTDTTLLPPTPNGLILLPNKTESLHTTSSSTRLSSELVLSSFQSTKTTSASRLSTNLTNIYTETTSLHSTFSSSLETSETTLPSSPSSETIPTLLPSSDSTNLSSETASPPTTLTPTSLSETTLPSFPPTEIIPTSLSSTDLTNLSTETALPPTTLTPTFSPETAPSSFPSSETIFTSLSSTDLTNLPTKTTSLPTTFSSTSLSPATESNSPNPIIFTSPISSTVTSSVSTSSPSSKVLCGSLVSLRSISKSAPVSTTIMTSSSNPPTVTIETTPFNTTPTTTQFDTSTVTESTFSSTTPSSVLSTETSTLVTDFSTTPSTSPTTPTLRTTTAPIPSNISDPGVPFIVRLSHNTSISPYSCMLQRSNQVICSCVILSRTFAVSPCNKCLRDGEVIYSSQELQLSFLRHIDGRNPPVLQTRKIKKAISHPDCYNANGLYNPKNDVGIIQISGNNFPLRTGISLPVTNLFTWDPYVNLKLSNLNLNNPAKTNWNIYTQSLNNSFCVKILGSKSFNVKNICISYQHHNGILGCKSDIGSALSVGSYDGEVLVGLLINKYECGAPHSVGGCVKMTEHIRWIRQQVNKLSDKDVV